MTPENQKLGLASSGAMTLNRPNKVHATRTAGFADVEVAFDGTTLTLLGKNANDGRTLRCGFPRKCDRPGCPAI
jgi:hypothetical protein